MLSKSKQTLLLKLIEKVAVLKPSSVILSELERIAFKLGVDEKYVLKLYVEMKNRLHKSRYESTDYKKRVLLLPQCLRARDCPAKFNKYGYVCEKCGKCSIAEIVSLAEELGVEHYILPGGSVIEKLIAERKPEAILGVSCLRECVLGAILCEKYGVAGQGVPLLKDGCVDTEVDVEKVKKVLKARAEPR